MQKEEYGGLECFVGSRFRSAPSRSLAASTVIRGTSPGSCGSSSWIQQHIRRCAQHGRWRISQQQGEASPSMAFVPPSILLERKRKSEAATYAISSQSRRRPGCRLLFVQSSVGTETVGKKSRALFIMEHSCEKNCVSPLIMLKGCILLCVRPTMNTSWRKRDGRNGSSRTTGTEKSWRWCRYLRYVGVHEYVTHTTRTRLVRLVASATVVQCVTTLCFLEGRQSTVPHRMAAEVSQRLESIAPQSQA